MDTLISSHLATQQSFITPEQYTIMYQRSLEDPEEFWAEQAELYLSWDKKWQHVLLGNLTDLNVRWFSGAEINACYNCLDRHLPQRADQTALIWEGDEPDQLRNLTYAELHDQVCRFGNALRHLAVKKGDRVCIYMPMIPEAIVAMLACARIGAIHSVVFAGFSSQALKNRIQDAACSVLITADASIRGGKTTPLKENVDAIRDEIPSIEQVVVVRHSDQPIKRQDNDHYYDELIEEASPDCPIERTAATDPLFILYTSGSTGKPKGILHNIGGYLLFTAMSFKLIFDYHDGDVFWCTADIGWITGHSYSVYGPLANGATCLLFSGSPNYPTPARYWQIIDRHQVNIFYTAPTAIRALMRQGDDYVQQASRKSLKLLGTVGEPINPDVWLWYYERVGDKRCPIVDTWWQTETGGIMLSPLPGATALKPGATSWPFFGVAPAIVNERGKIISGTATGNLVITQPWPGQLHTIYGDIERYKTTYFSQYPGYYCTGDGAYRDEDGYYWISGRTDDVINVSGHRLDTAEIESALVAHPDIAEAAVVGVKHDIKGQGIYAFVTPKANVTPDEKLHDALIKQMRHYIGPIATPDVIHWTTDLPKTRSGKIMRRILKKIVNHETDDLGDISTLANPEVVQQLIDTTKK